MRRRCSWRKEKFSGKKEKRGERRLETGQLLKVILNLNPSFPTELYSFAERDKVKKRKKPKESSAQAAPPPKLQ